MKTVTAAKIAAKFNEYLEASRDQPVLITRNGKVVAVLMAVQDKDEAERLSIRQKRSLRSVFQAANEQIDKDEGIPRDRFWQEVQQNRTVERRVNGKKSKASQTRQRPAKSIR